ncbi:MAG: sirohydrochlorin cobaltochelatase [Thermodesulfobacteriota bacterium]
MKRLAFSFLLVLFALGAAQAHSPKTEAPRWGIVLAAFGSTHPGGMAGLEKVKARFEAAFPGLPVRVGFTSRNAVNALKVDGVLTAMARLSDEGIRRIFIQPLHVSAGAEYDDLKALARGLNAVARAGVNKPPFEEVTLGEPPLGKSRAGDPKALEETARALAGDAALAREQGAALVYGAHGNPKWPAREFISLQAAMAKTYPGLTVLAGTLESKPGVEDVLRGLKKSGKTSVLLYPLLFGAGVHAADDLCGGEPGSWRSLLEKAGYRVDCRMRGLGEMDSFADMLVSRAREALEGAR